MLLLTLSHFVTYRLLSELLLCPTILPRVALQNNQTAYYQSDFSYPIVCVCLCECECVYQVALLTKSLFCLHQLLVLSIITHLANKDLLGQHYCKMLKNAVSSACNRCQIFLLLGENDSLVLEKNYRLFLIFSSFCLCNTYLIFWFQSPTLLYFCSEP